MTVLSKSSLQALFETGDIPGGTDYANFIDSCVNLAETSAQNMQGSLITTELVTTRVSAGNANFTGVVSAANINAINLVAASANISGSLSVSATISANAINISGDFSAATGTVYTSAIRSTNGMLAGTGIVSAAGTAQGTATLLANIVNRGKGVTDGSATGFALPANKTGLVQYIYNDSVSANLWPPTGGAINALSSNAAFALAANTLYTICHITASAYAVK